MPVYEPELKHMLFVNHRDLQRKDKIEFELSYWGIDGEIMDNMLIFEVEEDFVIKRSDYRFSRALYFSEDGSGGTWAGSDEYFCEWRELIPVDPDIYRTPNHEEAKPYPVIPEAAIIEAEKELEKNPIIDYTEHTGSFMIKLHYLLKAKEHIKEIVFNYSYGD